MPLASMLLLATLPLAPAVAAEPTGVEITPYVGFRSGATLQPTVTGFGNWEADPAPTFGVVLDFPVRHDARIEVFYERQELEFVGDATPAGTGRFDLTIDGLEVGGVYEPHTGRNRPFVGLSAGVTHLAADAAEIESSLGLSGSIGGGTKLALGERVALRLELRGHAVFSDGAVAAACGPGCSVSLEANGWFQFAGRVGLVIRLGK